MGSITVDGIRKLGNYQANLNMMNTTKAMKLVINLVLVSSILINIGCATIVSRSNYPVTVSSNPTGAVFTVKDKHGIVVYTASTPTTIKLKAGDGSYFGKSSYLFSFDKEGYRPTVSTLSADLDGWYIGNIFIGGLIGFLIVDPLTGSMYRLRKQVHGSLTPDTEHTRDTVIPRISPVSIEKEFEVTHFQYSATTNKGEISVKTYGRGMEAREWLVKNIGMICSSMGVVLKAGEEPTTGGPYRLLDQKIEDGILTIHFEYAY